MTMLQLPLLLAQASERVGSGRIEGGWSYVWAAYAITWTAFGLYALSLWLRRSGGEADQEIP